MPPKNGTRSSQLLIQLCTKRVGKINEQSKTKVKPLSTERTTPSPFGDATNHLPKQVCGGSHFSNTNNLYINVLACPYYAVGWSLTKTPCGAMFLRPPGRMLKEASGTLELGVPIEGNSSLFELVFVNCLGTIDRGVPYTPTISGRLSIKALQLHRKCSGVEYPRVPHKR